MAPLDHDGDEYWKNRHGFPQGYHYMPTPFELLDVLGYKLAGRPLPDPFGNIFHDVRVRDFNPADLHELYKEYEEAGFIYFFSEREPGGSTKRAARLTEDGWWKASGGAKKLTVTENGGSVVGLMLTLVFYKKVIHVDDDDKSPDDGEKKTTTFIKTDWAMHEFAKIIGPNQEVASTAIYRLYTMRSGARAYGCAAATVGVVVKPPRALLPPPASGENADEAYTSQPQAETSIGDYPGEAFGVVEAVAQEPELSNWAMTVVASPPVQLHDDDGNTGNTGLISWPEISVESEAAPNANYTMMLQTQQQEGIDQLNYSTPGDHCVSPLMVLPPSPTPPPTPLMASVSEPAALCSPFSSSSPAQTAMDYNHYMIDEFDAWNKEREDSLPADEPWVQMTEEESKLYVFSVAELLGRKDQEKEPMTLVEDEADTNQVQIALKKSNLGASN